MFKRKQPEAQRIPPAPLSFTWEECHHLFSNQRHRLARSAWTKSRAGSVLNVGRDSVTRQPQTKRLLVRLSWKVKSIVVVSRAGGEIKVLQQQITTAA